jgi:hypothetical protein
MMGSIELPLGSKVYKRGVEMKKDVEMDGW